MTIPRPERLPRSNTLAPDGREFTWGPVDAIHEIGPYQILEYRVDRSNHSPSQPWCYADHGRTRFQPYINGRSISQSFRTLDSALVGAVAYRREGPNGRAAYYFDRMTLDPEEPTDA